MTLLEFFFIISGIILLIISVDISKKQRFNALHFLVFIGVGGGLLLFSIFPNILNKVGSIFGVARGADVLVYGSIIFLLYFVLLLFTKHIDNKDNITDIIRELAIQNSLKKVINGKYVFVIPGYNEGSIIRKTISEIFNKGYENVIFINDGSKDNTLNELKDFGDKLIVLNHFKNRGQGAAIETGFEYIRRYGNIDFIITYDSDGQHSLDDIKSFEDVILKNPESMVFLGSRFKGSTKNMSLSRKIIIKLGIIFTFFISKIKLSDTHNGYRFIKKQVLNDIVLTIDGMGHASEILDIISSKNIPFIEVPVNIKYTDYSLKKGQNSGNAINIALRIIWNKFFR